MAFGRKPTKVPTVTTVQDPTGWMLDSELAEFLLLHKPEIKYMAMVGYTFLHGCSLFPNLPADSSFSYKLINMILKCNGGGIIVPILINSIPVTLGVDAYAIAIFISFIIHYYFPIVRDVVQLSSIFKISCIVLYETMRASVVIKLTIAAAKIIPPSEFSIPLVGPIICGTIAGCGGAFLPFNKGLDPIKDSGLAQPMISSFIASTFYHLFINTSLSNNIIKANDKAHILVAIFFITHNLATLYPIFQPTSSPRSTTTTVVTKTEGKKSQ